MLIFHVFVSTTNRALYKQEGVSTGRNQAMPAAFDNSQFTGLTP